MLPFNAEFQTGKSKITQVRLNVSLTNGVLLPLTEENVILSGFTRDSSTTIDGQFTIGAAVTGKLTAAIENSDGAYSGYDFRNAVITAYIGGQLSDGSSQILPVGIYTVAEYVYNGSTITLTAYDNLQKFDVPCSDADDPPVYPITLAQMVSLACTTVGVSLANVEIPNGSYTIEQAPKAWETMTWHDVIAYCAQIACCWAKILPNGQLILAWYDASPFNSSQIDGGTFDTDTTPYSDGAVADGGDFTYGTTTEYDGGAFGDRDNAHYLGSLYDLSIDTDDVQITGIIVTLDPSNNINATDSTETYTKKLGSDGYIIVIENNPLIETTTNADDVATYMYNLIVGIRFRPLNASIVENPAVEAGDVALVIDRGGNTYTCFLSHVIYTTNAATSISCDAARTTQNLKARYGEIEKTRALTQRVFKQAITDSEDAMFTITTALATTMGLYPYTVSDGQGGTIYVFGNKDTLAASNIQWRFTAGALMVSNDYGLTWKGAITPAGQAVLQEIYAVKVNADNILTGTLTVGGVNNQSGIISLKDASNTVCGTIDNTGVTALGSFVSYRADDGYASKVQQGRMYFYHSTTPYTYEQLKNLGWSQASGALNSIASGGGFGVATPKDYVEICHLGSVNYIDKVGYVANFYGQFSGHSERNLLIGDTYVNGDIHTEGVVQLKNAGIANLRTVRFLNSSGNGQYAYIGYREQDNCFRLHHSNQSIVPNLWCGSLTVDGTKWRAVKTEHYGTVGMNAFETANPYFADIGSGTVGEDGMVTIFFDPVFEETIETNMEYQVFLTRTSEAQTEWVDKQAGYFIVHGEPGATFDWMITCHQREYGASRMESIEPDVPYVSDDLIVQEDTAAIDAVNGMVEEYNEQLEDIA